MKRNGRVKTMIDAVDSRLLRIFQMLDSSVACDKYGIVCWAVNC